MKCCLGDDDLQGLLREDVPFGDLTTHGLGIDGCTARMTMSARGEMRVCGCEEAARLIELAGGAVSACVASGSRVESGALLLGAQGAAGALHVAWKSAQTLIEYLSGIASEAAEIRQLVQAAGFDLPLVCTRKNFPGCRALSAKAIRAGGAGAHRLGLSETILVFPEHRVFVDQEDLPARLQRLRRDNPEKKLVVEVASVAEAVLFAGLGAEILQLERFAPAKLAECRAALRAHRLEALLAPAGGVTRANAVAYAEAGADFLVSSAPYFAAPRDVKVEFFRA